MTVIVLAGIGIKYNIYKVQTMKAGYQVDEKVIGIYLQKYTGNQKIYSLSNNGNKPAIIFYSNKIVYLLPTNQSIPQNSLVIADGTNKVGGQVIVGAPTQSLYLFP